MAGFNYLIHPHKLAVIAAVAKANSITKAAELVHMTQPAVSNIIKQLEEHYQVKLFDVVGKTPHLTSAGAALLNAWQRIDDAFHILDDELRAEAQGYRGTISISAVSTAKYLLPEYIARFQTQYPAASFDCRFMPREKVLQSVLDYSVDLGLLTEAQHIQVLQRRKIMVNPMSLVVGIKHPLARLKTISAKNLLQSKFILREEQAAITQQFYTLFAAYEAKPEVAVRMNSTEAIKEAVVNNLGVALLPDIAVARELNSKLIKKLAWPKHKISNDWYLVWHKERHLSPLVSAFQSLLI